jgi:hypothetical protein
MVRISIFLVDIFHDLVVFSSLFDKRKFFLAARVKFTSIILIEKYFLFVSGLHNHPISEEI